MNPNNYDIYHLGVSGGKDSTAALLWLVYESGWDLSKLRVTFCDTSNEDPLTYAFLQLLSDMIFPITTLEPDLGFYELAQKKKRFPSIKARFCTQMLKIFPSREYVRELMLQHGNVLILNGVRKAEGHSNNNRGSVPQFGWDEGYACDIYRPVLDWNLEQVWDIHRKYLDLGSIREILFDDPDLKEEHKWEIYNQMQQHRIPRNPLYDMGSIRVGCYPCINSRKQEIRSISKYRPQKIELIAKWEPEVGKEVGISTFFRADTVPLAHRSKEVTSKKGETFRVCTINDVVNWSRTAWGGKQYTFEFPPASECDLGGMCE